MDHLLGSENARLKELVDKVTHAREVSVRYMDDQKRARQRSTDASRRMSKSSSTASLHGPIDKKLAIAKSELVQLEQMYNNFNQASTLLDLQNVHKKWEEELLEAKKEMRALKTENIIREKEIGRLVKNSKDLQTLQDRLRKEINTLRNRNRSLKQSMEVNESKFHHLQQVISDMINQSANSPEVETSKSVLSLELSVLQKQKQALEKDLEEAKSARHDPLETTLPTATETNLTTPVMLSPRPDAEAPPTVLQIDPEEAKLATPAQLSPVTIMLESRPDSRCERIHSPHHISPLPEIPDAVSSQLIDSLNELSHISHFVPRQLFQAPAAAEDDSGELGSRFIDPASPSPVPPPNVPKVFHAQEVARSLDFN